MKIISIHCWLLAMTGVGGLSGQDAHSQTGDPQFADPANGDFHIPATSPAHDTGTDVGLPHDFDGNPVVGTPDIGAFEVQ